jgi:hypothetical protein
MERGDARNQLNSVKPKASSRTHHYSTVSHFFLQKSSNQLSTKCYTHQLNSTRPFLNDPTDVQPLRNSMLLWKQARSLRNNIWKTSHEFSLSTERYFMSKCMHELSRKAEWNILTPSNLCECLHAYTAIQSNYNSANRLHTYAAYIKYFKDYIIKQIYI